jgi:N-acylneuraminate cytidylyltransferase
MPEESYFEIDEPSDWAIVEQLIKRRQQTLPDGLSKEIALFAMDCDGVLTDGGMYYGVDGSELKKFNTLDGMGVSRLRDAGIITALITSENTDIVNRRAQKLKIDEVFQGVTDKLSIIRMLADKYDITLNQVAYIGDDLNDLDVLKNVGFSITVPNATPLVRSTASFTTAAPGGSGAVREAAEMILSLAC